MLRGMSLRNTEYAYGLIIFTGHETKLMKNSEEAKYKLSKLEHYTTKTIKMVLVVQVLMSIIGGIMGYLQLMKEWNT